MATKTRAMRRVWRASVRVVTGVVIAGLAYVVLLVFPDPLFAHAQAGRFVVVHADSALPPETANVIAEAEARITRSALYDADREHHVYVCASPARWALLSGPSSNAGAVAMAPIGRSVFTREARFARNRLVGPSGREAEPPRTLVYYLAHEVTHTLTADRLGLAYFDLPIWVREGYADYVGRGETLDYEALRAAYLSGERELDPEASGHYARYALLVAHLLDREGWSVETLLRSPPDRAALEARIRAN